MEDTPMAVRPITAGPHLIFTDTGATRRGFGPACFDAVVCRRLDRPAPWGCRGAWRNESPTGQESRSTGHRAAPSVTVMCIITKPQRRQGMKAHVSSILLGVQDMDRSKRFYTEGLGWEVQHDYKISV